MVLACFPRLASCRKANVLPSYFDFVWRSRLCMVTPCRATADHEAWLLRYVNAIKATHVVVDFTGIDGVKICVEVGVGGC